MKIYIRAAGYPIDNEEILGNTMLSVSWSGVGQLC